MSPSVFCLDLAIGTHCKKNSIVVSQNLNLVTPDAMLKIQHLSNHPGLRTCQKTIKLDFAQFSQPRVICLRHHEIQVKSANKGYFEGIFFQTGVSQSSKISKRTHDDKNTVLIRTYFYLNTDLIQTPFCSFEKMQLLRCCSWCIVTNSERVLQEPKA